MRRQKYTVFIDFGEHLVFNPNYVGLNWKIFDKLRGTYKYTFIGMFKIFNLAGTHMCVKTCIFFIYNIPIFDTVFG